jgi:hypothetical protein
MLVSMRSFSLSIARMPLVTEFLDLDTLLCIFSTRSISRV